jgi:hypothetical protein
MARQRIKTRTPLPAYLVRLLTLVLGLAAVWYGLMVLLLAVKVSPHTVNSMSGYRTLYNDVAGLRESDFTTPVRLIAGFGGLLVFLVCAYLATMELPRPHLARHDVRVDGDRGVTIIRPRAIERIGEVAARQDAAITSASGRLSDDALTVDVGVRDAAEVAPSLRETRERVSTALQDHEIDTLPVSVIVTGYDPPKRRELQ